MRLIFLLLMILTCFIGKRAYGQQNVHDSKLFSEEKAKQPKAFFDISPNLKFSYPDGLVFTDSIRRLHDPLAGIMPSDKEYFAQSLMPVVSPGAGFISAMPVAVPDSMIHYFILQKKINLINPLEKRNRIEP